MIEAIVEFLARCFVGVGNLLTYLSNLLKQSFAWFYEHIWIAIVGMVGVITSLHVAIISTISSIVSSGEKVLNYLNSENSFIENSVSVLNENSSGISSVIFDLFSFINFVFPLDVGFACLFVWLEFRICFAMFRFVKSLIPGLAG